MRISVPTTTSVLLKDYMTYSALTTNEPSHDLALTDHGPLQTVSGNTPYPISSYVSNHAFSDSHKVYLAAITNNEAVKHKIWNEAMGKEVDAFDAANTWEIATLPPGRKALGNMWLYSYKYRADGTIKSSDLKLGLWFLVTIKRREKISRRRLLLWQSFLQSVLYLN